VQRVGRGRLELRSADPFDRPKIALNLLATENDCAELRRGIAAVRKLFATPPLVFTRALLSAWRAGVYRYGDLAARAGEAFESRWLAEGQRLDDELLERPDFSATTDLYAIATNVYAMRTVIYDIRGLLWVVVATALPFVPIWLTAIPFSAVVNHFVDALF